MTKPHCEREGHPRGWPDIDAISAAASSIVCHRLSAKVAKTSRLNTACPSGRSLPRQRLTLVWSIEVAAAPPSGNAAGAGRSTTAWPAWRAPPVRRCGSSARACDWSDSEARPENACRRASIGGLPSLRREHEKLVRPRPDQRRIFRLNRLAAHRGEQRRNARAPPWPDRRSGRAAPSPGSARSRGFRSARRRASAARAVRARRRAPCSERTAGVQENSATLAPSVRIVEDRACKARPRSPRRAAGSCAATISPMRSRPRSTSPSPIHWSSTGEKQTEVT